MPTVRQTNMLYLSLLIEAECSRMESLLESLLESYSHVYGDSDGKHYPGHVYTEVLDVLLAEIKSCAETIDRLASGGGGG